MKLIINIYRVYDADLYALNMTVGRKMFGELLVAALKGYAAGTKPGITFGEISIPNQAEGINKRVIHIQKTIKDGTPEADMLSSIQPRLTGLFVKNLLRWYYFGSFQPFYFSEETEIEIPKTQTAQPRPKITPQKKVEKVEKTVEKKAVETPESTVPAKSVSKVVEELIPKETASVPAPTPVESVTKQEEMETPVPTMEAVQETVTQEPAAPVEEESDNSGIEDLMSLFAGINVS